MSQVTGLPKIDSLVRLEAISPRPSTESIKGGSDFSEVLKNQTALQRPQAEKQLPTAQPISQPTSGLRFSAHAIDRLRSRGITFDQQDLNRLEAAIDKAAQKGSKDSLVLMDDSALIVSVKNKTIVTAMDRQNLKENVFTNIDSTVIL